MLCQFMLGIDDAIIVEDYHKSARLLTKQKDEGSAAADTVTKTETRGKLNRIFSGAPEEAMISTLAMIREKHGSATSYLDIIGFDSLWRKRFVEAMDTNGNEDVNSLRSKL